jgi:hypothetical protein
MLHKRLALLVVCLAIPASASAQEDPCFTPGKPFPDWLSCRVDRVLAASAGPAGDDKQAELPSVSDDSPTLVDTTSASDAIGLGLNLLGVRKGDQETSGTTTVTVTGYALLAAAYGRDPLRDPNFYYAHPNWRRVSFTLGRQPAKDDEKGLNAEAILGGVKILLLNLRELGGKQDLASVAPTLAAAAVGYSNIAAGVQELLRTSSQSPADPKVFLTDLAKSFDPVHATIDDALNQRIDALISSLIQTQLALRDALTAKIADIKRRPQLSVAWSSSLRDKASPDQHRFEGILDYGMAPRVSATANVGVDIVDLKNQPLPPGLDETVVRVAGSLKLALGEATQLGLHQPTSMTLSADLRWVNSKGTGRVQWKFEVPVTAGIVIPISITWANPNDLIDEKEVRGMVGFTIDTSKLAAGLR